MYFQGGRVSQAVNKYTVLHHGKPQPIKWDRKISLLIGLWSAYDPSVPFRNGSTTSVGV